MKRDRITTAVAPDDDVGEISIRLHRTQAEFVACDKPYKAFVGGRGAGKSWCGCYDYLVHAKPNTVGLVIAPTYRVLEDTTQQTFIDIATRLGLWDEANFRKTANTAVLHNNHKVLFRSGDEPNKIRGGTFYRIYSDECSLLKEDVYNIAIACLRWPNADQLVFTGTFTPSGKEHWTYRVFGDKSSPNVALFHCSTKDNPFLPAGFYERIATEYGRGQGGQLRALQELEGQFVCVEGAEWGAHYFGPQAWFSDWPQDDRAIKAVMLDSSKGLGGKSGDYSCFAMVMFSRGKLWVEFDMDNTRNASDMAARAIEIQKTFHPDYFGVEAEFGGNVLVDDLANRAEQANILMPLVLVPTQGVTKDVRIRRVTPYLTRDMMRFRATEQTRIGVAQMESFPHATHDDSCDALEGAIRIINESGLV